MANGISKSQLAKDSPIVRVSFPSLGGETTTLASTPSVSVTPTSAPNVVISSDFEEKGGDVNSTQPTAGLPQDSLRPVVNVFVSKHDVESSDSERNSKDDEGWRCEVGLWDVAVGFSAMYCITNFLNHRYDESTPVNNTLAALCGLLGLLLFLSTVLTLHAKSLIHRKQ